MVFLSMSTVIRSVALLAQAILAQTFWFKLLEPEGCQIQATTTFCKRRRRRRQTIQVVTKCCKRRRRHAGGAAVDTSPFMQGHYLRWQSWPMLPWRHRMCQGTQTGHRTFLRGKKIRLPT